MTDIRDIRERGFFWIDNEVLDHYKNISVHGVAVYAAICRHSWNTNQKATITVKELSESSRCCPNIVRRSVAELVASELIEVEEESGAAKTYTLLKLKKENPGTPSRREGVQGVKPTPSRRESHPLLAVSTPIRKTILNNTNQELPAIAGGLHGRIAKYIQAKHEKRFGIKCQWEGGEGKILSDLIKSNPSWSPEDYQRMVDNRFSSEGIVSERPRKWMSDIGRYFAGPLDRFGKAPETNKLSATNRARENAFNEVFGND